MVVRRPFVIAWRSSASMCGLALRVFLVVWGNMAGAAGVAGRGIGSGLGNSAGETLDKLTDPS